MALAHCELGKHVASPHLLNVSHGAGLSAWHAAKIVAVKKGSSDGQAPSSMSCFCGKADPSLSHLMWCCPALRTRRIAACGDSLPTNRAEERLLLRLVEPEPGPTQRCDAGPPEALDFAVDLLGVAERCWPGGTRMLIATDGGADLNTASWAAVGCSTDLHGDIALTRAPLGGEDATSFAAELEAIRQAHHALLYVAIAYNARLTANAGDGYDGGSGGASTDLTGRDGGGGNVQHVTCLIDCLSAIEFVERVDIPPQRFAQWNEIRTCRRQLSRMRVHVELVWTPSHGKHLDWVPPPYADGAFCRDLNHIADINATAALRGALQVRGIAEWKKQCEDARLWSTRALRFAAEVAEELEHRAAEQLTAKERGTLRFRLGRPEAFGSALVGRAEARVAMPAGCATGHIGDGGPTVGDGGRLAPLDTVGPVVGTQGEGYSSQSYGHLPMESGDAAALVPPPHCDHNLY